MPKYVDNADLERMWATWYRIKMSPHLEPLRISKVLWYNNTSDKYLVYQHFSNPLSIIDEPFGLSRQGYTIEDTHNHCWAELSQTVYVMCTHISGNFHLDADATSDLIHEAWLTTILKIKRDILKFESGKAPAFNLLTTAIMRIMYSLMGKETRYRRNQQNLSHKLIKQECMLNNRSLRVAYSGLQTTSIG
jgi:hypothetical protein